MRRWFYLLIIGLLLMQVSAMAEPVDTTVAIKVLKTPIHSGRISPMLYGGFIELLDDLVPGMWAELLNDRGFEGAGEPVGWCYYTGEPTFCDRKWEENGTWILDNQNPFNGDVSVRLDSTSSKPASLVQSGLGVRKGMTYNFSGHFRTDNPSLKASVIVKYLRPDGKWMTLGKADLTGIGSEWKTIKAKFSSSGTTDKAVFELRVTGKGQLWADKLSLMPSDNINGWRKDVVEVIKAQKPSIIRWGGCFIDPGDYKWKNGIGDRDNRNDFPNRFWGRNDPNDVGTDEFIQFCKAVGAEPLICICLSDGAESARDLVEYCNGDVSTPWGKKRTENGHAEPYNVKYWQLGNELGGEAYSTTCVDFCKAIKSVDPNTYIMSSFPSKELFEKVGQYISYTCPHHYSPDVEGGQANIVAIGKSLKEAGYDGKIKLGITEWNWSAAHWGLNRGNLGTLACNLYTGRYLNMLQRNSDLVDIACRSNMTNSYFSGMIETNMLGVLKRAPYHVMKLYGDHSKPIPMKVEGAHEKLDISACMSDDGSELCLFVVNTHEEPIKLSLDLNEFGLGFKPVGGEVVKDTLDRRQLDLMNHWKTPDRISAVALTADGNIVTIPGYSVAAIECAYD